MKNFTILTFSIFALTSWGLLAEDNRPLTSCKAPGSLDIIGNLQSSFIFGVQKAASISGCSDFGILSDIRKPKFKADHDELKCAQIDMCIGGQPLFAQTSEAKDTLKKMLPKAALLGVFADEVKDNFEYNVLLNRYETEHKENICGEEKVEPKCEKSIRDALTSVTYSFIDFAELNKFQTTDESLESFVEKTFFKANKLKNKKITKEELKKSCSQKMSLNNICKKRNERLDQIKKCEKKSDAKDCLRNEQKALASLLNDYKGNEKLFLAMEKELCLPSRMVIKGPNFSSDKNTKVAAVASTSLIAPVTNQMDFIEERGTRPEELSKVALADPSKSSDEESNRVDTERNGPDASSVVGIHKESLDIATTMPSSATAFSDQSDKEVIISADDNRNGKSLSETFVQNSNNVLDSMNSNSNVNNMVNQNNYDYVSAKDLAKTDENITSKTKNDNVDALTSKIDELNKKLSDMTKKVEDLKNKTADSNNSNDEKSNAEKDAKENEAAILELKKQVAELKDKKRKKEIEVLARAKEKEEEKIRAENEAAKASSNISDFSISNNNQRNDGARRDQVQVVQNYAANPSSNFSATAESKAVATIGSSGVNQAVAKGITLTASGMQAATESNVAYMTPAELQKYLYRLDSNAAPAEIQKMLAGNEGAAIIVGDNEKITPIVENGVVQKDKFGKIKFKRVKISLVKNEKEKRKNIDREISSVADLKKDEQKKQKELSDLVRYQQMKKAFENPAGN